MNSTRMMGGVAGAVIGVCAVAGCQSTRAVGPQDVYEHAAVAADHPLASQAGIEMLRRGGNAVDAAVASSFCLSVVRPYSCGIGGGGFMLVYQPGRDGAPALQVAINYRETAPRAVGPEYYVALQDERASRYGHHAVAVPGTVAGLLYALERFGSLDLQTVLEPAIRAAEEGFPADASHVHAARDLAETLHGHPDLAEGAAYIWHHLCLDGTVMVGQTIRNPDQALALRLIAEHGAAAFYRGPIARAIVQSMREHGGPITGTDLRGYRPSIVTPLVGRFNHHQILSIPPPSSGGIAMQQILGIFHRRDQERAPLTHNAPEYVHLLVEAMKHAYADRAEWLADPAFVDVPVDELLEESYLDRLAERIRWSGTQDQYAYGTVQPAPPDGGTSHVSVIDSQGMAVACTETINLTYGSLVVVPGFGFALNNEMDDFTTIPGEPNAFGLRQSDRNLPEPGKRPLSSMSPTIVLRDGRPVIVAGASGGPRIITATVQCILNCLLFDMTPIEAVAQPRFHHQWLPDVLQVEDSWSDQATLAELERLGHEVRRREEIGVVQLIHVAPDGSIRAASDPRKGGRPAGY